MKYKIICKKCGETVGTFDEWFAHDQKCPHCGSNYAEVVYPEADYSRLPEYFKGEVKSHFQYFDYLPLENRDSIVTSDEGAIPMERWEHMEREAKEKYGIDCKVYMYRNDLNGGTHSFKDVSGSLAASVMKEHGVKEYCLASTGNAGTAYAHYLAKAGIKFTCFSPSWVDEETNNSIRREGQTLVVSKGSYGDAKAEVAKYHEENHVMMSAGNTDPIRVESKRTIVFECMRQLGQLPTVYMQAVAGGTAPIALEKGYRDVRSTFPELRMPRMILVQQDECDPMVTAWEWAREHNFPVGFENKYEAKKDCHTRIGILTAANPGNYPIVAPLVRNSGGDFVRVEEAKLPQYGVQMRRETGVLMGPASMVCYAGFYKALEEGLIKQNDVVLLNAGEGTLRSKWFVDEVEKLERAK
ncbi:MAG: pyridoxal-phosphate dependent enzyme [Bacteroidales bacterium]|nr:pyridoxal-phosphate dependent enzyme [Candidatus Colimorpha merdihippi]